MIRSSTNLTSLAGIVAALGFSVAGCLADMQGPPELSEDPGVIYSYPHDGQIDVPLGARIVVSFTDPIDLSALATGCSLDSNGVVQGGFCVRGPSGFLPDLAVMAGRDDNVVHFEASSLEPGTAYEVYVSPALLWDQAQNLRQGEPLFSFATVQPDAARAQAPSVWAINGEDPQAFVSGSAVDARFPFLDFSTIRLVMSEPLDEATAVYGSSVRFVDASTGVLVDAALLVQGQRMSIDPVDDLSPDTSYRLELGAGVLDREGEAMSPASFVFEPLDSLVDGERLKQVLSCIPALEISYAAGSVVNQVAVSSPLIGQSTISMKDSTLSVDMGNPAAFGPLIPLTIRKGQILTMEALPVKLGGEISTPLTTGDIKVQMASDATVYLVHNPFRDAERLPDDLLSPVYAHLTFDIVVTALDSLGNAVLNQTVLNVQASGLASVHGGGLGIESIGALELDLLGLDKATTNMVLRLRTTVDREAAADVLGPEMTSAYPAQGEIGFPTDQPMLITFSEGIDAAALTRPGAITLSPPAPVRVSVSGSTLVVTPTQPLAYGTDYTLNLGGAVRDLSSNPWSPPGSASLRFRTEDLTTSSPMPLAMVAVRPGVPCALEDGDSNNPGRCRDGDNDDDLYAPFTMPAGQPAEVHFNQPLDGSTVSLGFSCDTGNVRVERLGAGGACVGTVAGELEVRERALVFVPDGGWQAGVRYRLVLHGGNDDDCDPGELCGRNGMPLNSDVLDGIADDDEAGGPDVALPFTGVARAEGSYFMTTRTLPLSDANGNGYIDAGERASDANRAATVVRGVSGMIQSVSLNGPDCVPSTPEHEACLYLSGTLPVAMGSLQQNCNVGGQTVDQCIPVEIFPQILYGTSLSMDARVSVIGTLEDQRTEQLVLRMRSPDGAPVMGHIIVGQDGLAIMRASLDLYMDAPSMRLLAGLAGHDLESKPLSVVVEGPVEFEDDGRIRIELANTTGIPIDVKLSAIGIGIGHIQLEIPAGQMKLQLVAESAKGAR